MGATNKLIAAARENRNGPILQGTRLGRRKSPKKSGIKNPSRTAEEVVGSGKGRKPSTTETPRQKRLGVEHRETKSNASASTHRLPRPGHLELPSGMASKPQRKNRSPSRSNAKPLA